MNLIQLTSTDYAVGVGYVPVYVNVARVAYVQPMRRRHPDDDDKDVLSGCRLYFDQDDVLTVREDIDVVLALLEGRDYDRELKVAASVP